MEATISGIAKWEMKSESTETYLEYTFGNNVLRGESYIYRERFNNDYTVEPPEDILSLTNTEPEKEQSLLEIAETAPEEGDVIKLSAFSMDVDITVKNRKHKLKIEWRLASLKAMGEPHWEWSYTIKDPPDSIKATWDIVYKAIGKIKGEK